MDTQEPNSVKQYFPHEEKEVAWWVRALCITLAVGMLAGGIYWQHLNIKKIQPSGPNDDNGTAGRVDAMNPPAADAYPWVVDYNGMYDSLAARITPPANFRRIKVQPDSFAHWLRYLPVKSGESDVLLYGGKPKRNQHNHSRVLKMDLLSGNQQAPDSVLRLRAEYLLAMNKTDAIRFRFTSGLVFPWKRWQAGDRVEVKGKTIRWKPAAGKPDRSYANFCSYLKILFAYASSLGMTKDMQPVKSLMDIQIGDVFVVPGRHAAIVVDMAEHTKGYRVFLLAQGGTPAQEMHIVKNPVDPEFPNWFPVLPDRTAVRTSDRTFPVNSKESTLWRFKDAK